MGVDPAITLSIAKVESGYRHEARSAHGAVGVFQLMPSTARRMGFNPYSLDDNIKAGIMYYKSMYKMFGSIEMAVAAYNAGPGNVKKYKSIPPFRETKRFVSEIMSNYYYLKAHTDPAIIAYNKSKQQPAATSKTTTPAQTTTTTTKTVKAELVVQQKPVPQETPQVDITPQVVASAPTVKKAPIPMEKAKSVGQSDILDSADIPTNDALEM